MKQKLGWILFSIMTVAVIVLTSVLISYNVRWKSGEELLNIDAANVQSAYLYHNILATAQPEIREYDLNEEQINYIVKEFSSSRFKSENSHYDGGDSGVVFKLIDGREISFTVRGDCIVIDGKQYKCHSYLTYYISKYGFDE